VTLTFDIKINTFQELTVEHFYVKFGDPAAVFDISHRKTGRQTDKRRWNPIPATTNKI